MKKLKLFLAAIILSLTLTGCGVNVNNQPIVEQQSLLQKCSVDTPLPTNFVLDDKGQKVYNGVEVFNVLRDWQDFYNKCASMHNKLVDTINGTDNLKKVPKK